MAEDEKRHAITEAIFTISFDRSVTSVEAERFAESSAIKGVLPRLERPQVLQFNFGASSPPPAPAELYRQRFSPNGDIEWRMGISNNNLQVNCLVYDVWDNTWPNVLEYFVKAADADVAPVDNKVAFLSLHILNDFTKEKYSDPRACLRPESGYLPVCIQSTDKFRIQLDLNTEASAAVDEVARTNLQITYGERQETGTDHLTTAAILVMKPRRRLSLPEFLKDQASECFGTLRTANRKIMQGLLTSEVCTRIGLEEESTDG